ncbi:hypothetical protein DH2020_042221 [Rehmannia glutinosa]|uniref:galactinol--sucrose galactosyltransferase n=1 Tax=Rehmannia glutinosa TaxID=99300 RepID=A0ABR0UNL3_REHGL
MDYVAPADLLSLADGRLRVSGNCILTDIHENIFLTPAKSKQATFIGVKSDQRGSRVGIKDFMPLSIQVMVDDSVDWDTWHGYTLRDSVFNGGGDFRAVLQGNAHDELEICLESGDPSVQEYEGKHLVYVAAGPDPYSVIENSIKYVTSVFNSLSNTRNLYIVAFASSGIGGMIMPDILNWFGWCTWDAFYTDVTAEGVKDGIKSLEKGGAPPKFVIIDDGWQSVGMDSTSTEAKCEDSAKYVYIWHAIVGYWGGVKPGVAEMAQYDPKIVTAIPSLGVESNGICFVLKSIMTNKVGLVNPEKIYAFYNDLHSYLASAGIDGVKVDNQSILETLGTGFGGRVKLARKYHDALEASISRNFKNNGIISCMSHSTDALYCAKKAAVIRASDDFFPRDPASHTIHIASVAYNSIFLGEFMQPDWDMFHSLHPMAEYHGAARAIGGCAIYVSDKPGNHDFDVLKKLVLPDGSTLRAKLPGRPTRDCLFSDPTRDGKSLLKIWNMNDFTGVVGVFNCQGASWCRDSIKNLIHDEQPETISGIVQAADVQYLRNIAESGWNGDCIAYSHRGGKLVYVPEKTSLPIQLKAREYEVFTVVPVRQLSNGAAFAPIGLVNMFNSGGAIKQVNYESKKTGNVDLRVVGCGIFGAYSSVRPKNIVIDDKDEDFDYEDNSGFLTFTLRVPDEELYQWNLTIEL